MKSKGGLAIVLVLLASAVMAAPAHAVLRHDYVTQADPLCQAAQGPLSSAQAAYQRNLKRLAARLKSGRFQGVYKQVLRTAGALNRFTSVHAGLTSQLSGVPPPDEPDATKVRNWLQLRQNAEALGHSAATSLKRGKLKQFLRQINQAAAADSAGVAQIADFGFQFCGK